jgi:hypothetical protein
MKGGKEGRGRKNSNARHGGKSNSRNVAKKPGDAKRDGGAAARKAAKRTTKLGARRVADDD